MVDVCLWNSWSSRKKPDLTSVREEPIITPVDDSIIVVVSIKNLIVSFWIPPEFDISISFFVKPCSCIRSVSSINQSVCDHIFFRLVCLIVYTNWIKRLVYVKCICSSNTFHISFIPKILISVNFKPSSLILLCIKITNSIWSRWAESPLKLIQRRSTLCKSNYCREWKKFW